MEEQKLTGINSKNNCSNKTADPEPYTMNYIWETIGKRNWQLEVKDLSFTYKHYKAVCCRSKSRSKTWATDQNIGGCCGGSIIKIRCYGSMVWINWGSLNRSISIWCSGLSPSYLIPKAIRDILQEVTNSKTQVQYNSVYQCFPNSSPQGAPTVHVFRSSLGWNSCGNY